MILLMGFELETSDVESDLSSNWAYHWLVLQPFVLPSALIFGQTLNGQNRKHFFRKKSLRLERKLKHTEGFCRGPSLDD